MARPRTDAEPRDEAILIRVTRSELSRILEDTPTDSTISTHCRSIILARIAGTASAPLTSLMDSPEQPNPTE